ncbi:hypothetical protein QQF64_022664 [Cirrhinus molitorella]|uniref:Uncharacterized protein n=1 Tax=Cirrhinus molitorella TaxID=172907 RepID=A0ABR3L365_9TELE
MQSVTGLHSLRLLRRIMEEVWVVLPGACREALSHDWNGDYKFPPIKVSAVVQEENEDAGCSVLSFEYPELSNFQSIKKKELYITSVKVTHQTVLRRVKTWRWSDVFGTNFKACWRSVYKLPIEKRTADLQWRLMYGAIATNRHVAHLNPAVGKECVFCGIEETTPDLDFGFAAIPERPTLPFVFPYLSPCLYLRRDMSELPSVKFLLHSGDLKGKGGAGFGRQRHSPSSYIQQPCNICSLALTDERGRTRKRVSERVSDRRVNASDEHVELKGRLELKVKERQEQEFNHNPIRCFNSKAHHKFSEHLQSDPSVRSSLKASRCTTREGMREKPRSVVPPESLGGSVDSHESTTVSTMIEAWDKFLPVSMFGKAVATKVSMFWLHDLISPLQASLLSQLPEYGYDFHQRNPDTPDMYTVSMLFSPGLLTGSDTTHSTALCCSCLRQSVIWVGWPPAPTNRARDCHTTLSAQIQALIISREDKQAQISLKGNRKDGGPQLQQGTVSIQRQLLKTCGEKTGPTFPTDVFINKLAGV